MADPDNKPGEAETWPNVDRRKTPDRRVPDSDRRSGNRVVTEIEPRRQRADRRKQ